MVFKSIKKAQKTAWLKGITFLFAAFVFIAIPSVPAKACTEGCFCDASNLPGTLATLAQEHADTALHIAALYLEWSLFLITDLLFNVLPALHAMAEQVSATAMQQMSIIGKFLDAKTQLETQRDIQRLELEVMKDYTPASVGVCEVVTNMRSLASSERYTYVNAHVLSQRSQDRQLGHINSSAVEGEHKDRLSRMNQFRERYCQPEDNAGGLVLLCRNPCNRTPGANPGDPPICTVASFVPAAAGTCTLNASNQCIFGPGNWPPDDHKNKDINYSQLIDTPRTIGIDFCDSDALGVCTPNRDADEDDEQDIFALANNLYSHDILMRIPDGVFQDAANRVDYLDIRSLVAKRSVAENSFNIITAMKTKGNPDVGQIDPLTGQPAAHVEDTRAYTERLLLELGLPAADMDAFLGEYPSYYAQMEVLTKKLFQRPDFYTELYEHPSHVERKSTALRAVDLMQSLDTLKSSLRTEMMLSILLEVELMEAQKAVENELFNLRP
jgi:hypothetical protein